MALITKRSQVVKKSGNFLDARGIPYSIVRRSKHAAIVGEYLGETFSVAVPSGGDWRAQHLVFKGVRMALDRVDGRRR